MVDLETLKKSIEDKTFTPQFLIFKYTDIDFLPYQYINEISKFIEVEFVDSLILPNSNNIFDLGISDNINTHLQVYSGDFILSNNRNLIRTMNLIVICKTLDKELEKEFEDSLVVFPKLEDWQIKNYVYSLAEGVEERKLDNLISVCNGDIFRLDKELQKLSLFGITERKYVFDKFVNDGVFSDLSNHTIFDFTNALLKKDIPALTSLYKELENIDCEPLGVVTTLYGAIKNIIMIQLNPTATPESVRLPANRFWAIKKNNCGFYTKEELLYVFNLVSSIDKMLKSGDLEVKYIIDYIVCHMLSCRGV